MNEVIQPTNSELQNMLIKHLWDNCDYPQGFIFFSLVKGEYLHPANVDGAELMVGQWYWIYKDLEARGVIELVDYLNGRSLRTDSAVYSFTKEGMKIAKKLSKRKVQ
jgi:hypothetical protein